MTRELTFAGFADRLRAFISSFKFDEGCVASTDTEFNDLALALFRLQFQYNEPYRALCEARGRSPKIRDWHEVPAVPTSAFQAFELTSLSPPQHTTVFFSSGTTGQHRSRHFHDEESLGIYRASLSPWFERHLLADMNARAEDQLVRPLDKLPFLALTPALRAAPNSSLVCMFDAVLREFGAYDSFFAGRAEANGVWKLDMDAALFAIRKSMWANRPLVLLGTAFNFVHLLDHFAANNMRYQLARGSRVLETGGYKGQSRNVPKAELHLLITKHLGIAPECVVTEYGMSELSSQAYDRVAGEVQSQPLSIFRFPPWARAQIISPENGREVSDGETGLIRIFDLANVRSAMAIQTEDLGVRRGDGFELIGRASQAEPRGCSLMSPAAQLHTPP